MTEEKRKIIEKIHEQIKEKKKNLLNALPSVHLIEDGIIIRFFSYWGNCEDNVTIKYKKIVNQDDPNENVVFFYIPKGAFFDLKQRFYVGCMTCLSGKISLNYDNKLRTLEGYSKIRVESDEVEGIALENTYLITSSNRLNWSKETIEHVLKTHD